MYGVKRYGVRKQRELRRRANSTASMLGQLTALILFFPSLLLCISAQWWAIPLFCWCGYRMNSYR